MSQAGEEDQGGETAGVGRRPVLWDRVDEAVKMSYELKMDNKLLIKKRMEDPVDREEGPDVALEVSWGHDYDISD